MLRSERFEELVCRDRIHEVFECRPDIPKGFESLFVQIFRVDPLQPVFHVAKEKSGEFRSWICVCHNVENNNRILGVCKQIFAMFVVSFVSLVASVHHLQLTIPELSSLLVGLESVRDSLFVFHTEVI
jgi:hypothetical protein